MPSLGKYCVTINIVLNIKTLITHYISLSLFENEEASYLFGCLSFIHYCPAPSNCGFMTAQVPVAVNNSALQRALDVPAAPVQGDLGQPSAGCYSSAGWRTGCWYRGYFVRILFELGSFCLFCGHHEFTVTRCALLSWLSLGLSCPLYLFRKTDFVASGFCLASHRWLSWLSTGLSRGRSWVQLRPDQHSGSLNNWGESAALVIGLIHDGRHVGHAN